MFNCGFNVSKTSKKKAKLDCNVLGRSFKRFLPFALLIDGINESFH